MENEKFQFKFNHLDDGNPAIVGLSKMSEGNPGAATAIGSILDANGLMFGGMSAISMADHLQIYGSHLWALYSDICEQDSDSAIAVLNAVMLGWLDGDVLKEACSKQDRSGKSIIPVDELRIKYIERMLTATINFSK